MRRLDRALYRAKAQGRDRAETAVTVAGGLAEAS
jgi:PleD family two-component response regulator